MSDRPDWDNQFRETEGERNNRLRDKRRAKQAHELPLLERLRATHNGDPRIIQAADEIDRLTKALKEIANGEGYYGAQAREYKQIARAALQTSG